MKKEDFKRYKQVLETLQAELTKGAKNRDSITIDKSPDAIDNIVSNCDRELAIRNLDRESNLLRNVRAALDRLNDGTYGICVHCEEKISPKRLNAVPWTPYCIGCQEAADRAEVENLSLEELLVEAV